MILDAHQHFWRLDRGDYGWLTPDLALIHRDFGPADLVPLLREAGVDGTILVQAAPTVRETEYLLGLAHETEFVRGVVGWVDFDAPDAPDQVAQLASDPLLVGLRPMIQDIADDEWMLRPSHGPVLEAMIAHNLTFDALVLPRHLTRLRRLIDRHPDLRVVIDHGAKPDIAGGAQEAWATDMAMLARETRAFCKLSGLATEAAPDWTLQDLAPYAAHLLNCFSPNRLIWGSDWPVLRLAGDYLGWKAIAEAMVEGEAARAAVMGGTAARAYALPRKRD